jgi:hypothetical protein
MAIGDDCTQRYWLSWNVPGAQVVVLMVTNQDQAQSVLYGPDGAVPGNVPSSKKIYTLFACCRGV